MKLFFGLIIGVLLLVGVVGTAAVVALIVLLSASTEAGPTDVMIPEDLSIRLLEDGNTVELKWSPVEAEDVTLVVQRSEDGGNDSWVDVATFSPPGTELVYTEPRTETIYTYRIRAFDGKGGVGYTYPVRVE